jgi:hypothetical protein
MFSGAVSGQGDRPKWPAAKVASDYRTLLLDRQGDGDAYRPRRTSLSVQIR